MGPPSCSNERRGFVVLAENMMCHPKKVILSCCIYIEENPGMGAYGSILRYGNWNDCPPPAHHVSLHKMWFKKYGAEIVSVKYDTIEFLLNERPRNTNDAISLAKAQFVYCSDIVTQGVLTLSHLASVLLQGKYWYFWWD